jgi:hypothetical protein
MNGRSIWQQFVVYSTWSIEALIIPPVLILLIPLIVSTGLAILRERPWRTDAWHWSYWLALTQVIFFPLIVAVGVLFPAISSWPSPQSNIAGERWLNCAFYGSLATGVYWIYRMKGLRWFAASLIGLQQLVLACAGFIVGMSVTGQWL